MGPSTHDTLVIPTEIRPKEDCLYTMYTIHVCIQCILYMSVYNVYYTCLYTMYTIHVCIRCILYMSVYKVYYTCLYTVYTIHVCIQCILYMDFTIPRWFINYYIDFVFSMVIYYINILFIYVLIMLTRTYLKVGQH